MSGTYDDLVARVEALESAGGISLDQLPMADLMRRLETDWKPDSAALLQPASIITDLLAAAAVSKGNLGTDALNAFLKLLVATDLKWTKGSSTCTWAASADSGQTTIPHGLGHTPVAQGFCPTATNALQYSLFSKDGTNIIVTGRDTRNTALTGTFGFDWWAVG